MGLGRTIISEDVFVELAKTAMQKVDNVVAGNTAKDPLGQLVKSVAERFNPHIQVKKNDKDKEKQIDVIEADAEAMAHTVSFELKLTLVYGVRIPDVVANVRKQITEEVEKISGYKVDKIDVLVNELIKPEKLQPQTAEH